VGTLQVKEPKMGLTPFGIGCREYLFLQAQAAELLNAHLRRLFTRRHAALFPFSLFHLENPLSQVDAIFAFYNASFANLAQLRLVSIYPGTPEIPPVIFWDL